jgi:hypothetical protein
MNMERSEKIRNQVKSKFYYIFWGAMSAAVVGMCAAVTHSNYTLASSRDKMAESIREYVLVKPFPILCRNEVR